MINFILKIIGKCKIFIVLAFRFSSVTMRYRPHLPLVLKNVSLEIKSKEKIGIVGRTGSGMYACCYVLEELKKFSFTHLQQGCSTLFEDE